MKEAAIAFILSLLIGFSCNINTNRETVLFDYINHQISTSKSKITLLGIYNPCNNVKLYQMISKENKVGLETINFDNDALNSYYDILDTVGFFKEKPDCAFIQIMIWTVNSHDEFVNYSFFEDIDSASLNKKVSLKSEAY